MPTKLEKALAEAEKEAWESLSRYKFQMFGYWASIWVHLNKISGQKRPNPWRPIVLEARRLIGERLNQRKGE